VIESDALVGWRGFVLGFWDKFLFRGGADMLGLKENNNNND
jgi:hypothetical protein